MGSVVRPTTLRPLILVAVCVACKSWFDETTLCSDLCDVVCGDRLNLRRLLCAEATFVTAIRFRTVVSRKVFVKYYFALNEVVTEVKRRAAPAPMSRRRDSVPASASCLDLLAGKRLSGNLTRYRSPR
jgi:hypothetical protein